MKRRSFLTFAAIAFPVLDILSPGKAHGWTLPAPTPVETIAAETHPEFLLRHVRAALALVGDADIPFPGEYSRYGSTPQRLVEAAATFRAEADESAWLGTGVGGLRDFPEEYTLMQDTAFRLR